VSRLDSVIRRLTAQRDCLAHAAVLIAEVPGPALEIGLGNGRTYDHLRELLPGRAIYAFDRAVKAHPACVPDPAHLLLGDFRETFPLALARTGARAALAHCDFGSGDATATRSLADWLGPALAPLLAPGAVVASDQALALDAATTLPLPPGVRPGRYFLYRVAS